MGIAPLVAAVQSRPLHWAFGIPAAPLPAGEVFNTGPNGPIGVRVELCFDPLGVDWTDITSFVYYRDRIKISRGRANEASQVPPQTCSLTLNNRDGRFSPLNPTGTWYGLIGRNTPIRVSRMANGSNVPWYRFYGEVPSWPSTADISGSDVYVQIQAAGFLRRLNQGAALALSAMTRYYTLAGVGMSAYWPCEDASGSTSIASGISPDAGIGAAPMSVSGQSPASFAAYSGLACSSPLPTPSSTTWIGAIPTLFATTSNVLRFLLAVPATGSFDTAVIARLFTAGKVARLDLQYGTINNGSLQLSGYSSSGTQLFSSGYAGFNVDGKPVRVSMELNASGGNINWSAATLAPGSSAGTISGTISGSIGNAFQVTINPDGHIDDTAIGHISYQDAAEPLDNLSDPLNAWLGESNTTDPSFGIPGRFQRVAEETLVSQFIDVAAAPNPYNDDTVTLGQQMPDTFLNLLQQCTATDLGIIYEARDQAQLVMRGRLTLYNQAPALALDASAHQLSAQLQPVDDDAFTRNDVSVSRINGSSARQTLAHGAMSTDRPPGGVGPYPDVVSISLGTDAQCADQARWRLHMGTISEARYPTISLNLRHPAFTSNLALLYQALDVDIGSRITVANPGGVWLPPDPISQIVQGYTETLGVSEHDIALNCSPESAYRIAVLDDPVLARADTDGSRLSGDYGPGSASLAVFSNASAAFGTPVWTTNVADFPFDINVGGERMTVTNITGTGTTQTFTVTRSVNGVVKPQLDGTDVRLWKPMILSL